MDCSQAAGDDASMVGGPEHAASAQIIAAAIMRVAVRVIIASIG